MKYNMGTEYDFGNSLLSKNKKYIVIIYMNKYNGGIIYALKSYPASIYSM